MQKDLLEVLALLWEMMFEEQLVEQLDNGH